MNLNVDNNKNHYSVVRCLHAHVWMFQMVKTLSGETSTCVDVFVAMAVHEGLDQYAWFFFLRMPFPNTCLYVWLSWMIWYNGNMLPVSNSTPVCAIVITFCHFLAIYIFDSFIIQVVWYVCENVVKHCHCGHHYYTAFVYIFAAVIISQLLAALVLRPSALVSFATAAFCVLYLMSAALLQPPWVIITLLFKQHKHKECFVCLWNTLQNDFILYMRSKHTICFLLFWRIWQQCANVPSSKQWTDAYTTHKNEETEVSDLHLLCH